ncbi:MAG: dihydroxyacetone kinase subunit L [Actinobacteria bacterium]|nr:dihydroxyacetone kinase subunit L [Actinomycetota bacterium]MBM3713918.1 dihydroxyacetone kinase subunit L [Actinomycetota bacterium]
MAEQKGVLIRVVEAISKKLIDAEKILTELDSMGDADCGVGVRRGFEAVLGVIPELFRLEPGDLLKKVGFTLAYTIGGTSGAMLGTGFIETGKYIADNKEPSPQDWVKAVESALDVIKRRGGNTQVGDKTLVDSLEPAVEAMENITGSRPAQELSSADNKKDMLEVLQAALNAAKEGSDKTIDMVARKGRASYLGERSRGNRDPGSLVIVLMFEAAVEVLGTV